MWTGSSQTTDSAGWGWAVLYTLAILVATLSPAPDFPGARDNFFSSLVPSGRNAWFDVIENVGLYVPLGIALSARRMSLLRICSVGGFMAATVELLQFVVPGRDPSARDIVANTLGTGLGAVMLATSPGLQSVLAAGRRSISRLLHPGRLAASALSFAWAALVVGVLTASAFLLSPAPRLGRQYVVAGPLIVQGLGPVTIGGRSNPNGFFKGLIDDVRIYARARSEDAVNADMGRPVTVSPTPDPDLIAAFNFDGAVHPIVPDDSGRGHGAVNHGALWLKDGRYGGALMFDGRSSELVIQDASQMEVSHGLTLEAWVFPIGEPATKAVVIAQSGYYLTASSSEGPYHPSAGVFGGANAETRTPHPIRADMWTHLAMTYDTQSIRIYVNGRSAVSRRLWSPHQPERMSLNNVDLAIGPVADTRRLCDALVGDAHLDETLACGSLQSAAAPVLLVTSAQNIDAITLLAEGSDLLVRPWTWARRLGLRSPDYRFQGFFSGCSPGQRVKLEVKGHLQAPRAARNGQEVSRSGLGVGSGWAFLIHSDLLPEWLRVTCTLGWLGLLVVPFGYWMRRSLLSVAGAILVFIAVAFVPSVLHVRMLDGAEASTLVCGVAVGAIMRAMRSSARSMTA
jgi:VanZ family protein